MRAQRRSSENAANGTRWSASRRWPATLMPRPTAISFHARRYAGGRFAIDAVNRRGHRRQRHVCSIASRQQATTSRSVQPAADGSFNTAVLTININDIDEFDVAATRSATVTLRPTKWTKTRWLAQTRSESPHFSPSMPTPPTTRSLSLDDNDGGTLHDRFSHRRGHRCNGADGPRGGRSDAQHHGASHLHRRLLDTDQVIHDQWSTMSTNSTSDRQ